MNQPLREGGTDYGSRRGEPGNRLKKTDLAECEYPKGYVPALSIAAIQAAVLVLVLVGLDSGWYGSVPLLRWYDAVLAVCALGWGMNCVWLACRQNFGGQAKFAVKKAADAVAMKKRRRERLTLDLARASNNVADLTDYLRFAELRAKKTRRAFWVSFGIQSALTVAAVVLEIAMSAP